MSGVGGASRRSPTGRNAGQSWQEAISNVFVGVYERQLDERGRVALPPSFRSTIGEQCYLTYGDDGCVRIMSDDVFQAEAQDMIDKVRTGEVSRAKQRVFASSVVRAGIDKQGRVLVDPRLRSHAAVELQAPVTVLGALDRIEIWEPTRFEEQEAEGLAEMNR
jgi:MraZ protein